MAEVWNRILKQPLFNVGTAPAIPPKVTTGAGPTALQPSARRAAAQAAELATTLKANRVNIDQQLTWRGYGPQQMQQLKSDPQQYLAVLQDIARKPTTAEEVAGRIVPSVPEGPKTPTERISQVISKPFRETGEAITEYGRLAGVGLEALPGAGPVTRGVLAPTVQKGAALAGGLVGGLVPERPLTEAEMTPWYMALMMEPELWALTGGLAGREGAMARALGQEVKAGAKALPQRYIEGVAGMLPKVEPQVAVRGIIERAPSGGENVIDLVQKEIDELRGVLAKKGKLPTQYGKRADVERYLGEREADQFAFNTESSTRAMGEGDADILKRVNDEWERAYNELRAREEPYHGKMPNRYPKATFQELDSYVNRLDEVLTEYKERGLPKPVTAEIPKPIEGMPEAGLQAKFTPTGEIVTERVTPTGKGVTTQASLEDFGKLQAMRAAEAPKPVAKEPWQPETAIERKARVLRGKAADIRITHEDNYGKLAPYWKKQADALDKQASDLMAAEAPKPIETVTPEVAKPAPESLRGEAPTIKSTAARPTLAKKAPPQAAELPPSPPIKEGPPPAAKEAPAPPPEPDWKRTVTKIATLTKQAKPATKAAEEAITKQKGVRLAKATQTLEKEIAKAGGPTPEAYAKARTRLGGAYEKPTWQPIGESVSPAEWKALLNRGREYARTQSKYAIEHPDYAGTVFFVESDIEKSLYQLILGGTAPTEGQLKLLTEVYGRELIDAVLAKRKLGTKVFDEFLNLINLPRAVLASFDVSYPLRQGAVLAPGEPKVWLKTYEPMFKSLFSEKYFNALEEGIVNHRFYILSKQAGLDLTLERLGLAIGRREEATMSKWITKIPGLRMSARAYNAAANYMRFETFGRYVNEWQGMGKTLEDYKALATFINRATGRGGLGPAERYAPVLNATFFSPRLLVGRITTPLSLLTSTPTVRKIVARDLASFIVAGTGILALLKFTGVADVELDPRSSDFGKIRIGNTRYDFWAGYQPLVRYTVQAITGQRKEERGPVEETDRAQVFLRFLQSKLSPQASIATDIMFGKTFIGEELRAEKAMIGEQLYQRLVPMFIQDVIDAYHQEGPKGIGMGMPSALGVGVQSYQTLYNAELKAAARLFPDKTYDELNRAEKRQVREDPKVANLVAKFEGRQEWDTGDMVSFVMDRYDEVKKAGELDMRKRIDSGAMGKTLRQYVKDFKETRYVASQALISDAVSRELEKNKELTIEDALAERYWSVPLPENLETGEFDFAAQEAERAKVLQEADKMGVSRDYITDTGEGTWRGKRFEDPVVRSVVETYESAIEKLRSYWDIRYEDNLSMQSRFRERFRRLNPDIDATLAFWGFVSKPLTLEGRSQLEDLETQYERILKGEQTMTETVPQPSEVSEPILPVPQTEGGGSPASRLLLGRQKVMVK